MPEALARGRGPTMPSLATLAAHNATAFLGQHAVVLVLYASAQCGQSHALLPELRRAASLLDATPATGPTAAIAQAYDVDLAAATGVSAVPSLRLHRGFDAEEYATAGPLTAERIAADLLWRARTQPVTIADAKALDAELRAAEALGAGVVVLAAGRSPASPSPVGAALLRELAGDAALRDGFVFASAPASALGDFWPEDAEGERLIYMRTEESHTEAAELGDPAALGADAARAALRRYALPLLGEISASSYRKYAEYADAVGVPAGGAEGGAAGGDPAGGGRVLFWLFLNRTAEDASPERARRNAHARALVRAASAARRRVGAFGHVDVAGFGHHARALGAAAYPALAAEVGGAHYVYASAMLDPHAADADADAGGARSSAWPDGIEPLMSWVDEVAEGRAAPTLRSAAPPLANFGPVLTVVGSTLEPLVLSAKVRTPPRLPRRAPATRRPPCRCSLRRTRPPTSTPPSGGHAAPSARAMVRCLRRAPRAARRGQPAVGWRAPITLRRDRRVTQRHPAMARRAHCALAPVFQGVGRERRRPARAGRPQRDGHARQAIRRDRCAREREPLAARRRRRAVGDACAAPAIQ